MSRPSWRRYLTEAALPSSQAVAHSIVPLANRKLDSGVGWLFRSLCGCVGFVRWEARER